MLDDFNQQVLEWTIAPPAGLKLLLYYHGDIIVAVFSLSRLVTLKIFQIENVIVENV